MTGLDDLARMARPVTRAAGMVLTFMLAACSSEAAPPAGATPTPMGSPIASEASTQIAGLFDVGDYSLYLECVGTGAPTVVYLHGYISEVASGGRHNSGRIPSLLSDRVRVCKYDRVNVGKSDKTDEVQTGLDAVHDLNALLAAANIPGPYVLLGASFGGLIAYEYAFEHPDDVVGMVLLDPALPGDHELVELIPEEERPNFDAVNNSRVERLDDLGTSREAQALPGPWPDIPMTLVAAEEPELPAGWPVEEFTAGILRFQEAIVDRFPRGQLVFVDSPHFMEQAIPERVAEEVDAVLDSIQVAP